MVQTVVPVAASQLAATDQLPESQYAFRDYYLRAFRHALLARIVEDKLASLYRGGKITGGVYIGRGQEAISVSLGIALRKGDIYAPLIRDQAGRLAFGEPLLDAFQTYFGSPQGPMRARDGNIHRGRPLDGLYAMISHLGAMISVVNGSLMALRMKGVKDIVGATTLGDGGTSTGAFHEAMNQACVEKLPLIMLVVNNQYAYSTPNDRQFACADLVDRAIGYGAQGHTMDGTDLAECLRTMQTVVNNARAGQGPQLVVANVLRLCGHGEHDDAKYVSPALKAGGLGRDCLKVAEDHLLQEKWATAADIRSWREAGATQVEDAVALVQREAAPDPYQENWCALKSSHLSEGGEVA